MAGIQAHVMYDFAAQGDGELSVTAGETITVLNQDVGDGWWEGRNDRGQTGLFPANYVEAVSSAPPSMPPPPLPADYGNDSHLTTNNLQQQMSSSYPSTPQHQQNDGGWDDEWDDDDDDDTSTVEHNHANNQYSRSNNQGLMVPGQETRSSSTGDVSSIGKGDGTGKSVVRRNFNRFSTFVKSGGEDYIIGKTRINVIPGDYVQITESHDGSYVWAVSPTTYHCLISSPKKASKLKGLKSYIAYQITPSFNNIVVSRRYKHFDWLHQRLQEKFSLVPVPPLPDKQISGRYEEAFIEHRRLMLQSWVDRITRHPLLSQSDVWMHFITCTDEKSWKVGKRKAEKDELIGATFFQAIKVPDKPLDPSYAETQIEMFIKFVKSMDDGVRNLQIVAVDQIKKHTGPYKRECQKIGQAFKTLASAFDADKQAFHASQSLVEAIRHTGNAYEDIGLLYEEEPRYDFEPMSDVLHEYKGMLAEFPDILAVHKGALQKTKEFQKSQTITTDIEDRMKVISCATLAEMSHFKGEITVDLNKMMKDYLTAQINFYEKIGNKLKDSLKNYD